jgi:hypothetical protein
MARHRSLRRAGGATTRQRRVTATFVIISTIIAINLLLRRARLTLRNAEIVHGPDLVWRSREVLWSDSGGRRWLAGYAKAMPRPAPLMASANVLLVAALRWLVARLLASDRLG